MLKAQVSLPWVVTVHIIFLNMLKPTCMNYLPEGTIQEGFQCPIYNYNAWIGYKFEMNCGNGLVFHCAREYYSKQFIKACAVEINCTLGTEPLLRYTKYNTFEVLCKNCFDFNRTYNPFDEKLSSTMSQCPEMKLGCDLQGVRECPTGDPKEIYSANRKCRCDARNNYVPDCFPDLCRDISSHYCSSSPWEGTSCYSYGPCPRGEVRLIKNFSCVKCCSEGNFRPTDSDECIPDPNYILSTQNPPSVLSASTSRLTSASTSTTSSPTTIKSDSTSFLKISTSSLQIVSTIPTGTTADHGKMQMWLYIIIIVALPFVLLLGYCIGKKRNTVMKYFSDRCGQRQTGQVVNRNPEIELLNLEREPLDLEENLNPEGENLNPERENLIPEGEQLNPEGEDLDPEEGENLNPEGENLNLEGENQIPEGEHLNPEGELLNPEGENLNPEGENLNPEGENQNGEVVITIREDENHKTDVKGQNEKEPTEEKELSECSDSKDMPIVYPVADYTISDELKKEMVTTVLRGCHSQIIERMSDPEYIVGELFTKKLISRGKQKDINKVTIPSEQMRQIFDHLYDSGSIKCYDTFKKALDYTNQHGLLRVLKDAENTFIYSNDKQVDTIKPISQLQLAGDEINSLDDIVRCVRKRMATSLKRWVVFNKCKLTKQLVFTPLSTIVSTHGDSRSEDRLPTTEDNDIVSGNHVADIQDFSGDLKKDSRHSDGGSDDRLPTTEDNDIVSVNSIADIQEFQDDIKKEMVKSVLKTCYTEILKDMDPNLVCPKLYESEIIDYLSKRDIDDTQKTSEKNIAIFNLLQGKISVGIYDKLKTILFETKQLELINKLQHEEENFITQRSQQQIHDLSPTTL